MYKLTEEGRNNLCDVNLTRRSFQAVRVYSFHKCLLGILFKIQGERRRARERSMLENLGHPRRIRLFEKSVALQYVSPAISSARVTRVRGRHVRSFVIIPSPV